MISEQIRASRGDVLGHLSSLCLVPIHFAANMYLTSPGSPYRRVLLVGSDALSRWIDWSDRNTCILFGDAAGAAVLAAPNAAPNYDKEKPLGLLSYVLHSDGSEQKQIRLPYSGTECSLPYRYTQVGMVTCFSDCIAVLCRVFPFACLADEVFPTLVCFGVSRAAV